MLKLYHTLHVCLQKVCGAILINAASPQCYISSRTQSAFSILKHCTRENAFDTCDIVISHTACLPAKSLQRNSHQCYISSMLHLLRDSDRVLIFGVLLLHTRGSFDTSVIVISHSACLPAKGLRRNSHQCYISSMLHLLTVFLTGWKLCLLSLTRCETLSP